MTSPPLSTADRVLDHELAELSSSFSFILDVTPVDADQVRETFLAGENDEPEFTYRELGVDPEVIGARLAAIDPASADDGTVARLLSAKHRELKLQLEMLQARGSAAFRDLSVELYGPLAEPLVAYATEILEQVEPTKPSTIKLDAEAFLQRAQRELDYYRQLDPSAEVYAEIRPDSTGVMVNENVLIIGPESAVDAVRVDALLQHEVGTHLVTRVNGVRQPLTVFGTGLAGYDETQEGLAVLAEIAVGQLTPGRLRQLAARVLTVQNFLGGAGFRECWQTLVDAGFRPGPAYTTVMRVFRGGGLTKDAVYLRGLLGLLGHLADGGSLEPFFLGKFALSELDAVEDLLARGVLQPPSLLPRWFDDSDCQQRIAAASRTTHPSDLLPRAAEKWSTT